MADATGKPKRKPSRKGGGRAPTGKRGTTTRKASPSTRRTAGGRTVVDLHSTAGYVEVPGPDGTTVRRELSIIEQAAQTFRYFGRWADAAAKVGMHADTLRGYVEHGAKVRRNRLAGELRARDLTAHDRQCVELLEAIERAEADGRLMLLGIMHREAQGYQLPPKRKTRTDADGNVVQVETTIEHAQPNVGAAQWLLERTYPDEFGRTRVEVTGKDGEPLVDVSAPLDRINAMLDAMGANAAAAPTAADLEAAARIEPPQQRSEGRGPLPDLPEDP